MILKSRAKDWITMWIGCHKIHVTLEKERKDLLTKVDAAIVREYSSQLFAADTEKFVNIITSEKINNADYNKHLKALGQIAGIKTRLHSHLARHTFATWMLRNGASIENVSKMLGHTNITQTQRYAKVLAQSVHDDFDKVAEKLKDKHV